MTLFVLAGCAGKAIVPEVGESTEETEVSSQPQEVVQPTTLGELPAISAKTYDVKTLRRSQSHRVYLLEKIVGAESPEMPAEGRILLLRRNGEPVMAFRILKQYPEKGHFAAKSVRQYGSIEFLENEETFRAIEKISDLAPPPPTEEDKKDLKELENMAPPPSEDVQGEPTSETDQPAPPPEELSSEEDQWLSLTADEVFPIDKNRYAIAAEFGYFRNLNTEGTSIYFPGGGFRYSFGFGKTLFFSQATPQDGLTFDAGAFFYKILNLGPQPDAYSVAVLTGTMTYKILLSEFYGFFFYGGLEKNIVVSSAEGDEDIILALSSVLPAVGGGLVFQVGPNWEARAIFGMDMIGGGIVLRF